MAGESSRGEAAPSDRGGSTGPRPVLRAQASYALYLACWVAALAVASRFLLRITLPLNDQSLCVLRAAFDAFPVVAMSALACYFWMRFHTGREVVWMLAALGFMTGAALTLAHMVAVVLLSESTASGRTAVGIVLTVSRLAPAALLASAAFSTATVPAGRARTVAARCMAAASLGAAFILLAAARLGIANHQSLRSLAGHELARGVFRWDAALASLQVVGLSAAAAAFTLAAIGFARTRRRSSEPISAPSLTPWLASMTVATTLEAIAAREGGQVWLGSGMAACAGAILLVLGGALRSGWEYRFSHHRTTELAAVYTITSALAGARELKHMAERVVTAVGEAVQASLVSLYAAKDENTLVLVGAYGLDEAESRIGKEYPLISEARSGFHTSSTARAFREQKVTVVSEALTECDFVPWRVAAKLQGYVVCVPLVHGGKCLAVLDLLLPVELSHLAGRERLFEMIAGAVAPAIEAALEGARHRQADEEMPKAA